MPENCVRVYEKDGQNHTVTFVQVDEITFTGTKKDSNPDSGASNPDGFGPVDANEDDLPF